MKLRCQIFLGNVPHPLNPQVFDQDIVKIGRLKGSTIELRDIGRMHAVLERDRHGVWRVIDLGSSVGTKLNNLFVDKNAILGDSGVLEFGPWRVVYETSTDVDLNLDPREHHRALFESLIKEARTLNPKVADSAENVLRTWALCDDERKRKMIRLLVNALREARIEDKRINRQLVASMLKLGPDGIAEIYDLEPAQALAQAHASLLSFSQAKAAFTALGELKLRDTFKEAWPGDDVEKREMTAHSLKGLEDLEELLKQEMVMGASILSACLSRAGGHVLTHRERVELRLVFEKIEKTMKQEPSDATSA
jgi:hypothetical protein